MRLSHFVMLSVLVACSAACSTFGGRSTPEQADYVLVYLKSGPAMATQTKEQGREIFAGHMANMKRMADAGDLVIAGPFDHPRDKAWRGIFLFNVATIERARELVATDPGIKAGVFVAEMRPVRGAASLRTLPALERRRLEGQEVNEGEPPPGIRGYVMVTAADGARAASILLGLGRIVWAVRTTDAGGRGGVFVVDATSASDVETGVANARDAAGDCGVDGWWSTVSLMELPPDAGEWYE